MESEDARTCSTAAAQGRTGRSSTTWNTPVPQCDAEARGRRDPEDRSLPIMMAASKFGDAAAEGKLKQGYGTRTPKIALAGTWPSVTVIVTGSLSLRPVSAVLVVATIPTVT